MSQPLLRVLGVDPGLTRCGIGVIDGLPGSPLRLISVGVIKTPSEDPLEQRLLQLERELTTWGGRK
jgi:crossover junction endodeoxyribonuclease RuvC